MTELPQAYEKLKNDYLKIMGLELQLDYLEPAEKKQWKQTIIKLVKQFSIDSRKVRNAINSKYEHQQLINHLLKSIDTLKWEEVVILLSLYDSSFMDAPSTISLCSRIEKILQETDLITHLPKGKFPWSKGMLLEELVKLLNPKIESATILKTMNEIVAKTDEEELENYHLIRLAKLKIAYLARENED